MNKILALSSGILDEIDKIACEKFEINQRIRKLKQWQIRAADNLTRMENRGVKDGISKAQKILNSFEEQIRKCEKNRDDFENQLNNFREQLKSHKR